MGLPARAIGAQRAAPKALDLSPAQCKDEETEAREGRPLPEAASRSQPGQGLPCLPARGEDGLLSSPGVPGAGCRGRSAREQGWRLRPEGPSLLVRLGPTASGPGSKPGAARETMAPAVRGDDEPPAHAAMSAKRSVQGLGHAALRPRHSESHGYRNGGPCAGGRWRESRKDPTKCSPGRGRWGPVLGGCGRWSCSQDQGLRTA